jgi:hypothetical protein
MHVFLKHFLGTFKPSSTPFVITAQFILSLRTFYLTFDSEFLRDAARDRTAHEFSDVVERAEAARLPVIAGRAGADMPRSSR